jgi:peptidoglycan/LPS O-acetylase OafA/YrhL
MSPIPPRKVFSALDGLRGVAAIAILLRHLPDAIFTKLLPGSYLAVDLFFVLSGFVLAHSYLSKLKTSISAAQFMVARIIRLYPLYCLSTFLSLAFFLSSTQMFKQNRIGFGIDWVGLTVSVASALLFLPTPEKWSGDSRAFPFDFPAWSLFFELVINLSLATAAKRITTRGMYCILVPGIALLGFTSVYWHGLDAGWQLVSFWGGAGRVIYSFYAGVAAYLCWTRGAFSAVKISVPTAMVLMLLIFALEPDHLRSLYDFSAVSLFFPWLVLAASRSEVSSTQQVICKYLGSVSYAIYVMQASIIVWVSQIVFITTGHIIDSYGIVGDALCIVIIVGAAYLLDLAYDPIARTWLRKLVRYRDAAHV